LRYVKSLARCDEILQALGGGRFHAVIAPAAEIAGCGDSDAQLLLLTFDAGYRLSTESVPWSSLHNGDNLKFTADPTGKVADIMSVYGDIYGVNGGPMPPGARVAGFIGGVLCGETSIPWIATDYSYTLTV